ncbi:MAG: hypothetical protein JKY61_05685 [Planctomycetes bacterium]|nr:hypothetical protein [Planctomycetota bacterium]
MDLQYPATIPICHDDHHAKYVGWTSQGDQFFLTTPFTPAGDGEGCEFFALYRFDSEGKFLSAEIDNLGPRETLDGSRTKERLQSIIDSLGEVQYGDINIQPFQVEKDGVEFGLIPTEADFVEDEEDMCLEFQPGNFMAFYPPWDGSYDT